MTLCRYDTSKECNKNNCDTCTNHPMHRQGRADGIRELRDLLLCMFDTYRSNGFNFDAERFLLNQLKEQSNEFKTES